jgi:UDP-N-acetylglucosamine:LPS N-acetylglucosamine transferase
MQAPSPNPYVAIACGGTGGHLYPGIAIAEVLQQRGCDVLLLISPKDVDQSAVRSVMGMDIETLPAVGLSLGGLLPRILALDQNLPSRVRAAASAGRARYGRFHQRAADSGGETVWGRHFCP